MTQDYQRDKAGQRLQCGGMNTVLPPDLMPPTKYPFLQNVRAYIKGGITGRARQDSTTETLGAAVHSLRRLNDLTPAGPVDGFILVGGAGTDLYAGAVIVDSNLSGNPISMVPFRPNASVQPWMYIGDSNKMDKVRSDGVCYKMGIAEPQNAPSAIFVDSGAAIGVNAVYYRYVYRSSETGAQSNPSPASVAGYNGADSGTGTKTPDGGGILYNGAQWELNTHQLRTTGAATSTPQLLDFMIAGNFGLTIPDKVTITGVEATINWQSQSTTGASISRVQLYYNNVQLGIAKSPGSAPQTSPIDQPFGTNGDLWGATLTPQIVNDQTFGFGIQIAVQTVRLFINSMKVTVYYENQHAQVTSSASADIQVDKIDYYRFGNGLDVYTYIGTGPNPPSGTFLDESNALVIVNNPALQFDNYEPFPSIDLPRAGTVNVSAGAIPGTMDVVWQTGDTFNTRWLPGTVAIIGNTAYTLYNRPSDAIHMKVILPDDLPTTTAGITYEIPEPILAAQPLPSLWGPTDNVNFMFACRDPLRPGVLYWTKGNNPDSAPDTNQQDVTSPSEPLQNGCIVNGVGMVFSTEKAWLIWPNFFNSLATVTGNAGAAWTLQESITDRGLYIPNALGVNGGRDVFFRGKDGIYLSPGGYGAKSITDDDIFNLFPHEGVSPTPVTLGGYTVYPPDDSLPQKINVANGYVYYDYVGSDANPHTLVFDIAAQGWVVDVYEHPVTLHILEEGPNINGTLVGCSDGTVRPLTFTGSENANAVVLMQSFNAGDARSQKHFGDLFIEGATEDQI